MTHLLPLRRVVPATLARGFVAFLDAPGEITRLLKAHHAGDRGAFDRLVPLVYDRWRALARIQLARERPGQMLSATGLVHEVYLQLANETGVEWRDRSHFFAICIRAMRRTLVDYARRRTAGKRGGGQRDLTLEPERLAVEQQAEALLAVDQALDRLASFSERLAQLVECRVFAGMTDAETAETLGVSLRTVEREWPRARAWLQKELGPAAAPERAR
jgi:RNA polymerase sigma factor (TIGR02999 family)